MLYKLVVIKLNSEIENTLYSVENDLKELDFYLYWKRKYIQLSW